MDFIRTSINKPVAVTVGVMFTILFGVIALNNIPIQLTPNVDGTVITVRTRWEGANPQEVEQDITEKQEDKLKGLTNLRKMRSESQHGSANVTLEFFVGTDRESALREVSDKLREVSDYPENVDEPVIAASDPGDRDYIAWIMFETNDNEFDVRTLQDFAQDRIKPRLERVEGIAEINVLGGREREVQVRVDPIRLAQFGLTYLQLFEALRAENVNISAGTIEEGKSDIALRTVGRFRSVSEIQETIIARLPGGIVRVGDVAEAVMTYKEPTAFVRSKGNTVVAINAQREVGTNVMEVMDGLKKAIDQINKPGGLLDTHAKKIGLNGYLRLRQVYDQTGYIEQAIQLVVNNIYIGGTLAIITLAVFLRSPRSVVIIALAIPISVVGTFVAMVLMGRNLNVVSLAGMAFAIGMVVDNAIVVLENIFRHLELGESPATAAYRGTREVWGAVLASTLTTVAVFVPILFVQEEAGQLFRDIALAICAAVLLSLIVSVTVIPSAARRWLRAKRGRNAHPLSVSLAESGPGRARGPGAALGRFVYWVNGSYLARLALVALFVSAAVFGTVSLMPPSDYLPRGNRNLVFGMMITPPGYNLEKKMELGRRVEAEIRPYWEAGERFAAGVDPATIAAGLPSIPNVNPFTQEVGEPITPPSLENYFFVGFGGIMFHGAVSNDPTRVVDVKTLLQHATREENLPGVIAFANQAVLFRLSGLSGSSISVELSGDSLDEVVAAASITLASLEQRYGTGSVQSSPGNFALPSPELRIELDRVRSSELGLTTRDIGLAVQALGDGARVGEYRTGGESIDLTVIDKNAFDDQGRRRRRDPAALADVPIATPAGRTVPLSSVARIVRTMAPQQINHVEQRRAVTLDVTPDDGKPLEEAMTGIQAILDDLRDRGAIPSSVDTHLAGSADKLSAVKAALLGDGTLVGLLSSRLFLALLIVYLLMCVLFESFVYPLVILLSVPLATLGGFVALYCVNVWSVADPYMPDQNLDVLTMLGFVILIGVVVNNAILLVHQALNFMRGLGETAQGRAEPLAPRLAIAESVRTRLRPILMSTLTSVGGMLPLVLMPGSGSELYRGLGSVVIGGLVVSTVFTLVLVPALFSLVIDLRTLIGGRPDPVAVGSFASEGQIHELASSPMPESVAQPARIPAVSQRPA